MKEVTKKNDSVEKKFRDFTKQVPLCGTYLLAFSGGPDSMALFHLLRKFAIPFEVAHLNHGWRQESERECEILREMCKEYAVIFHEKKISFSGEHNLEERAREERHAFFREVVLQNKLEGVFLGHHADDLAETVLKRLFEGASLFHFGGLNSLSQIDGIAYLRPILHVKKKEIVNYLQKNEISFFTDTTNLDPKFLRGRFRKEIFPWLSEVFGKEVTSSLCRVSQNSLELKEFLEEFLEPYRKNVKREEDFLSLDLAQAPFRTTFEWKCVVRDFFEKEKITLTTPTLEMVVVHLRQKNRDKILTIGSKKVKIDRGNLILFL